MAIITPDPPAAFIVSFPIYRPPARYDNTPWTQIRVEERATAADPWVEVETITLDPVDALPARPLPRAITTALGTLESGFYRLVAVDAVGREQASEAMMRATPIYRPQASDVAGKLRARTKDTNGNEVGAFTDDTRPTAANVEALIDDACSDVVRAIGPIVPLELVAAARSVVALRAAQMVELSYLPEQTNADNTVYQTLRLTYETELGRLINAVQIRDAFGEGPWPTVVPPPPAPTV
jgi:hypothetical protein